MSTLWDLDYWNSKEWETVNARLDIACSNGSAICPNRDSMFIALEELEPDGVTVVFIGQDPYPDQTKATGRAFDIPKEFGVSDFPDTLKNIFREYSSDLSLPHPSMGDLSRWVQQGVLLWNSIPSTGARKSLSHDWREYDLLTSEVLNRVSRHGAVFVFIGAIARRYVSSVEGTGNRVLQVPNPSAGFKGRTAFQGSRIFSETNRLLREIGKDPIDWRLA